MSWSAFWIAFLLVSLLVYGAMALLVSVRGAGELVTLVRRARHGEEAPPEEASDASSRRSASGDSPAAK